MLPYNDENHQEHLKKASFIYIYIYIYLLHGAESFLSS